MIKPDINAPLILYPAEDLLSAGDVVGRAVGTTRRNWRILIYIFAAPTFFYCFSCDLAGWAVGHPQLPLSIQIILALTVLLLLVLSRLEVRVLQFAILLFLAGKTTKLESAIQHARKRTPLIFSVSLPVMILDIALLALAAYSTWLMLQAPHQSMQGTLGLILLGVLILWSIPFVFAWLLNLAFLANLAVEDLTVWASWKRFTNLLAQDFGYIALVLFLYSVLSVMLEIAMTLVSVFSYVVLMFHGTLKEVANVVALVVECALKTPVLAFLSAVAAVTCAYLQQQLTARLECCDLIEKMDKQFDFDNV